MEEIPVLWSKPTQLNETLLKKAQDELGETDSTREESVALIKKWVETSGKDFSNLDNLSILWFLRGCKFNVERAQKRIETFYTFRAKVDEWYANRDPLIPDILELLDLGTLLPLPGRDNEGRKVMLIRATIHDPYKYKQDDVLKIMNMIVELLCRDDEAISVTGVVAVVDLKGVGMGHALQMTPSIIRKAVNSWQDVNPIRTKSMHFINSPLNVHVVLNIFKTFMKEKLRRRLHLHRGDGRNILSTFIPSDILPVEYGGTGPTIALLTSEWKDRVLASREWFLTPSTHGPFSSF